MGAGYFALGSSAAMASLFAALVIAGSGSGWLMPGLAQWVVSAGPEQMRAAAIGALTSCVYAGQFASPWLSQSLGAAHSIGFSFTIAGSLLLLLSASVAIAKVRMVQMHP